MADLNNTPPAGEKTSNVSNVLAYLIVSCVFFILIGLSIVVLAFGSDTDKKLETAKYDFASIVPLVGRWMGPSSRTTFRRKTWPPRAHT